MDYLISNYIVDKWSLVHVFVWFVCSLYFIKKEYLCFSDVITYGLVSAFAWEALEMLLFAAYGVKHDEPALNRWLADPIFDMIGVLGAYWTYLWCHYDPDN